MRGLKGRRSRTRVLEDVEQPVGEGAGFERFAVSVSAHGTAIVAQPFLLRAQASGRLRRRAGLPVSCKGDQRTGKPWLCRLYEPDLAALSAATGVAPETLSGMTLARSGR